ncbi:MAG: glycosyltransferase family 4 protein [Candidatus Sumerlaeota bacterium]|nr:glycosyltransferase family 4 protein [Candidatus Sumerlaeota bacterium]
MKICLLTRSLPVHRTGGLETHAWDLARGLARRGCHVFLLTTAHPDGRREDDIEGVHIHYIPKTLPARYTPLFFPRLNREILRLHEREGFDLVHSQGFAALTFRPPVRLPLIVTLHGTLFSETPLHRDQFREFSFFEKVRKVWRHRYRLMMYPFYMRFLRRASLILVDSRFSYNETRRDLPEVEVKLRLVPLGIDLSRIAAPDRASARARLGLPQEDVILFTLSRLEEMKGVDVALRGVAALESRKQSWRSAVAERDFIYLIGGEGRWRGRLEDMRSQLGISQVKFLGRIPSEQLSDYFAAADLFIQPERGHPAFGIVTIESLAHGTPVLASDAGATPEIITPEVGWLFKRGDAQQLAESLRNILPTIGEWRTRAALLRRYVEEHYSLERFLDDTLEVYHQVSAAAKGRGIQT